jgi:protein SCO1/2
LFTFESVPKPIAGHGDIIRDNVSIGGDFQLTDQNGQIFHSNSLKGRLSIIYFGFTYCPDICPTSLNKLSDVLNILDKYQIDIVPIFISIDPHRDNPQILKEYLQHFHRKLIGLTGTNEQIKAVADKFKVYFARSQSTNQNNIQYMIDHTSFIYFMDRNGKYLKHFYLDSKVEEIVEFIRINQ